MSERLNIRRMQMPERPTEVRPFDTAREISAEVWEVFKRHMDAWTDEKSVTPWDAQRAMSIKILEAQRLSELTEESWARIMAIFRSNRTATTSPHSMIYNAVPIVILDPTRKPKLEADEIQLAKNTAAEKSTIANLSVRDYRYIRDLTIFDKTLLPEQSIADVFIRDIDSKLNDCRLKRDFGSFVAYAAAMRFIAPGYQIQVTREDWEAMRAQWAADVISPDTLTTYATFILLNFAVDMKILAAEKVEVTEKGLWISAPKKLTKYDESKQLPEQLHL